MGDQRFSGLGPQLDQQQLHGGWQLTRGIFDSGLAHPNATLVSSHSPRLVLVKGFLSGEEVEHLVGLAQGEAIAHLCWLWAGWLAGLAGNLLCDKTPGQGASHAASCPRHAQ